ncbi:MAG: hypothetical protein U0694_09765 [Anaerolineae bacterium]
MPVSANQFFMLYTWFLLAGLLIFALLIARFYQKFSGTHAYYHWFLVPAVLLGVAVIRYTSVGKVGGDAVGDLFSAAGGVVLIGLCGILYKLMLLGRGHPDEQR